MTTTRSILLAAFAIALSSTHVAADTAGITALVTADVPNNTVLAPGQSVTITLHYAGPYSQIMQTFLNVEGMNCSGPTPAPFSVTDLTQGTKVIGTTILWHHDGSLSGTDSVTCTPNPALANRPLAGGGVNNGDGAGNGGLKRSNLVSWQFTAVPTPTPTATAKIRIEAVEITQSIQQFQTLDQLKTSLEADDEPPVPIIAGKPAVMRVYFGSVDDATTVHLHVGGVVTAVKKLDLQPGCDAEDARGHFDGCPSLDVYFTPPTGSWQVSLGLTDEDDVEVQHETLVVKSRETNAIRLRGVAVCDGHDGPAWRCGEITNLLGKEHLLRRMMPTSSVTLELTSHQVLSALISTGGRVPFSQLARAAKKVDALFTPAEEASDAAAHRRTIYFGMFRHVLSSTGIASDIPSHGAMAPDFVQRFSRDSTATIVAHEVGHTLNLRHTNVDGSRTSDEPGCYNLAQDSSTDWPFGTNAIQSNDNFEWPFNVEAKALLDPHVTYDLMSYCLPRWPSPLRYKKAILTLGGGLVTSPSLVARGLADAPPVLTSGDFWEIAGTVSAAGVVFDPLFTVATEASTETGEGTYKIEMQNGGGSVLFTRLFTPALPQTDSEDGDEVGDPTFFELVPMTAGAAKIVVKNPGGAVVGTLVLGGSAPTVGIVVPAAGFVGSGTKTVSWTITDPDSNTFTSRVLYSADAGAHWSTLGDVAADTALGVDFDALPGTSGATALIRVTASDGVNTGSATSPPFTVPKKAPAAIVIDSPTSGFTQAAVDPIILAGGAYDPDDGMLAGAQLAWSSSLQGALGTGSPLSTTLQPGAHTITLTATDADGNAVQATTAVVIGGDPPTLSITTAATTGGCTIATIAAAPGANGAPLGSVQFTVDGGASYTTIPLGSLPLTFVVPGSGSGSLTVRAYDTSQQSVARSFAVSNPANCAAHAPVCFGGTTMSGVKLTMKKIGSGKADGTMTLKGTLDFTPGNPAVFSPPTKGAQLLIEDLGNGASTLLDLTYFTFPFPPGAVGTLCGKKDGWKKLAYKNVSGILDPPACSLRFDGGLSLAFKDVRAKLHKGKSKGIAFTAAAHGLFEPSVVGPVRITVVLGRSAAEGEAGECAVYTFDAASCVRKKAGLTCKVK